MASSPLESDDTFYAGALKRTGTLYQGAREGVVKSAETISETASFGLKRTGTLYEGAKEGVIKSAGTISETAGFGLKRTKTMLQKARVQAWEQTAKAWEGLPNGGAYFQPEAPKKEDGPVPRKNSWGQWASSYTKKYYNPDRPIKASFREIAGVTLPRTKHSLSVIHGRAYIFGGDLPSGQLADNDMHLVILPSSSVLEADYKSIPARPQVKDGPVPAPRRGHTAVVVDNEIYIFGGQTAQKSPEEVGRIWVYDIISAKWTFHDPKPDAPYPPSRYLHSAVSSDLPGPPHPSEGTVDLVQQEIDPASTVPIPPPADSWGTMFIYGGKAVDSETILNDVWGFDISARVWFPLPPAPSPARLGSSFILADDILYRIGGTTETTGVPTIDFLEVGGLLKVRERGEAFYKVALPALLREWTTAPLMAPVNGAAICQVDSGTGKKLLLPISAGSTTINAVDVTPSGNMRMGGVDFPEQSSDPKNIVEVKVQYVDLYEEAIPEDQTAKHAFKGVEGFAVSAGTEVDAASLIIWGGKDGTGKPLDTGYLVTVSS